MFKSEELLNTGNFHISTLELLEPLHGILMRFKENSCCSMKGANRIPSLIVPTPLEGRGTINSNGFFFVQSILADRYIHRRELRLVALESLSGVEYGIKNIFLIFVFGKEISRFKLSRKQSEFR